MPTVTVKASSDAMSNADSASKNYGGINWTTLKSGSGVRRAFHYFNLPFPRGAEIQSAKFQLFQRNSASGGSRTLTVQRCSASWQESKLTHNKQPGVTGPASSVNQGNSSTNGRLWEFDVTETMQQVSKSIGKNEN